MRGPKTALIVGIVLVTAVSASVLRAQQGAGSGSGATQTIDDPPSTMSRSARQLLRNGLDYLDNYHDYDRALTFFRQAEPRSGELSEAERKQLNKAIEKARRGLREGPSVAKAGRPVGRPGALTRASSSLDSPVLKASVDKTDLVEPAKLELPALPAATEPVVAQDLAPKSFESAPLPKTEAVLGAMSAPPASTPTPAPAPEPVAAAPAPELPAPAPEPVATKPAVETPPADSKTIVLTAEPPVLDPAPVPSPAPMELPPVSAPADELPALPNPTKPDSVKPAAAPDVEQPPSDVVVPRIRAANRSTTAGEPAMPTSPPDNSVPPIRPANRSGQAAAAEPVPAQAAPEIPAPAAVPSAPPVVADPPSTVADVPPAEKAPVIEPAPADVLPPPAAAAASAQPVVTPDPDALPPLPPPISGRALREPNANPAGMKISMIDTPEDGLKVNADTLREVEEIAAREQQNMRDNPKRSNLGMGGNSGAADAAASVGSKAFQLPRAPSPTEPRPIRAIPVPEEFVPLQKREFEPNRKYWVAAATCHMPLYFQDAALERYGQGVEQAMGPAGRFFSYPLDDPTQSNQRNQMVQPMYSAGLFLVQFVTLPYNMLMDPPWEAEYDLGYYRPGDRVPRDTYYFPLTGVGPPLHGNNYGKPKPRKGWFLPIHQD